MAAPADTVEAGRPRGSIFRSISIAIMVGHVAVCGAAIADGAAGADGASDDTVAARSLYDRALASARAGNNDAAIELFQRSIALDPAAVATRFQLANSLAVLGRYAEASAAYAEAIRLDPSDARAWQGQAAALALDGRCAEARDRLRDGLHAVPGNLVLVHALARVLLGCADPEVRDAQRALELARKVYDAAPTPEYGETVGMAMAASGAFEDAARWQADLVARAERTGDAAWAERLLSNLERYRRGELYAAPAAPNPHGPAPR